MRAGLRETPRWIEPHYGFRAVQRSNQRSIDEFAHLRDDLGGLTPATVIIHGTALTHDQWAEVAAVGAKLVWSPQSNLWLYRETSRVRSRPRRRRHGRVGCRLAAVWIDQSARGDEGRPPRTVQPKPRDYAINTSCVYERGHEVR